MTVALLDGHRVTNDIHSHLSFVFSVHYNTMIKVANLTFEILSNSFKHRSLVSHKGGKNPSPFDFFVSPSAHILLK